MILLGCVILRATILDLEEALVAVGQTVGAAHWIVIRRTNLLAAAKHEALHASLHWHYVHVFSEKNFFTSESF